MSYRETIRAIGADPEQLENAYRAALNAGDGDAFAEAMREAHADAPDDLLYAAWRFRLAHAVAEVRQRVIAWRWAVPIAVLNGLAFWGLSGKFLEVRVDNSSPAPAVILLAGPIAGMAVLAFLVAAGGGRRHRAALLGAGLAAVGAYALLFHARIAPREFEEQYLPLAAIHLPLLAWSAVGLYVLWSAREAAERFTFLIKSLEVFIAGGVFALAGGLFTAVSFGLFDAIGIDPPEVVQRLFVAGGGGLIPVLAVAVCYEPKLAPARQAFEEGLSRFIGTLMRALVPLTIIVLAVYLALIPLHFRAVFEQRDVLIAYNGMLFALLALLLGGTPLPGADLGERTRRWLRRALVLTAALGLFVGAYALAAIVYRTEQDILTPNRLTFIGWNIINLGVLVTLLLKRARARAGDAFGALHETYAAATIPYAVWSLLVVLAVPWLFDSTPKGIAGLPDAIQDIVLRDAAPILLKCEERQEIYLLEDGRKRWIKDIPTFEARGYTWDDVSRYVPCDDLRAVPDGVPIPEDAGAPPRAPQP